MTTMTLSLLDQAELLQLALNASAADDSGTAIAYLKEAVSRPDGTAVAHYILGAEYAAIRMYDRAAGEMEAALALDPTLSIARLQLGLLWLTGGMAGQALAVFGPLSELAEHDPLRLFGEGLCHLARDQFADARALLQAGIAANTGNPPLNGDMQRMIGEIDAHLAGAGAAPAAQQAAPEPEASAEDAHRMLLSAYTGNTGH
jgi:tetratricopeptide (TPR) repeat protein